MHVRIAALADFASASEGSKINILGIFTDIYANSVPVTHPQMYLVFVLEFDSSEAGDKNIKIDLVDEDGRDMLSVNGEMHIERSPAGHPTRMNQIVNLTGMIFPTYGAYEFRIVIDGKTEAIVDLNVREIPSPVGR